MFCTPYMHGMEFCDSVVLLAGLTEGNKLNFGLLFACNLTSMDVKRSA